MSIAQYSIRAAQGQTLELESLRGRMPTIFQSEAHASRSDKFRPIATSRVIEALDMQGFALVAAMQSSVRANDRAPFARHQLRFRRNIGAPAVGGVYGEVILGNANDGTSTYTADAGLLRLICLNGVSVGSATFAGLRIPHLGNASTQIDSVIEGTFSVVSQVDRALDVVEALRGIQYDPDQKLALAQAAIDLRWPEAAPIEAASLLAVRRLEDAPNDAWNTLNVIQENIIRGGQVYAIPNTHRNARKHLSWRHVRSVKGIVEDTRLNKGLWNKALELAQIA